MLKGATGYAKGELVTGTIESKGATTYTPGTSSQTISSGKYLSGTQTIAGDADLVAGNILSDVNIFGVNGSHTAQNHNYEIVAEKHMGANNGYCDLQVSFKPLKSGQLIVWMDISSLSGEVPTASSRKVYINRTSQTVINKGSDNWTGFWYYSGFVDNGAEVSLQLLMDPNTTGYTTCSLLATFVS